MLPSYGGVKSYLPGPTHGKVYLVKIRYERVVGAPPGVGVCVLVHEGHE